MTGNIEKLRAKPEEFGGREALGEAIWYYVVGALVYWDNLLALIQPAQVVMADGDMTGFSGNLRCGGEVDCWFIIFVDYGG